MYEQRHSPEQNTSSTPMALLNDKVRIARGVLWITNCLPQLLHRWWVNELFGEVRTSWSDMSVLIERGGVRIICTESSEISAADLEDSFVVTWADELETHGVNSVVDEVERDE